MPELFPIIQPQAAETAPSSLPMYRECAWDFAGGRPLFRRGQPLTVSGNEAIKVWVWKALMTERTRWPIYSWNFGSEVETLIGQNYSDQLKRAEAVRYVREALEINPYIRDVSDITVGFEDGQLRIDARVQTIYGEVNVHV